jgi:hypothetical protein
MDFKIHCPVFHIRTIKSDVTAFNTRYPPPALPVRRSRPPLLTTITQLPISAPSTKISVKSVAASPTRSPQLTAYPLQAVL